MALFGSERDVSMFRHLNRELLGDIITQQCTFYKFRVNETTINMYGEAAGEKFYEEPVILNCLIDRTAQTQPISDNGVDFEWNVQFAFLKDDLVDAKLLPEIGDILLYEEGYFEIDTIVRNQLHVGKNPDYPNNTNPLNPGLEKFGYDVSYVVQTHYIPADKVDLSKQRF